MKKLRIIIWISAFVLTLVGVYIYWQYRAYHPSTDDAYIQAHVVHIAPQVSGPISQVFIENNQAVKLI